MVGPSPAWPGKMYSGLLPWPLLAGDQVLVPVAVPVADTEKDV